MKAMIKTIIIILALCLYSYPAEAKQVGHKDKPKGKVVKNQKFKKINNRLKAKGKKAIKAGEYTDVELADIVRERYGASLVRKNTRKIKKIKRIK